MAMLSLVESFQKLSDEGYCEEDILEAFAAFLERKYSNADEEDDPEALKKRAEDLTNLAKEWSGFNLDNYGEMGE